MQVYRCFYIFALLCALLAGCTSDQPAVIERKESLYYGQSEVVKLVTIKQEQTLESIAAEHNLSVAIVAKLNNLPPSAHLSPGQVIKLPSSSSTQFEEALYNEAQHNDAVEEIRLSDDEQHGPSIPDAYNSSSADEIKGSGYLGSITGEMDIPHADSHISEEAAHTHVGASAAPAAHNKQTENSGAIGANNATHNNFMLATPLNSAEFIWPVQGEIASKYGSSGGKWNEGINIAAPIGTPVRAIAAGSVIYTGKEPKVYGNLIIIKHQGNYLSAYAHNEVILVRKGAKVNQGDIIAKVGKTGAVSSPQLHFSMRKDKKTINPDQAE